MKNIGIKFETSFVNSITFLDFFNLFSRNIDEWFTEQQIKHGLDMKMKQGDDLVPDFASLVRGPDMNYPLIDLEKHN